MKKIIGVVVLALLVLLAGCAKTPTGSVVVEDSAYRELCKSNGNMFMTMQPTVDGVATGESACAGCMVDGSHYCDQEEYLKALKSNRGDMPGMDDMNMG